MVFNKSQFSLYSSIGNRKYLNRYERDRFYAHAIELPTEKRLYCLLMYYTGARVTEVYSLTPGQIDTNNKAIVIRSLKKKTKVHYRSVPIPDTLLDDLNEYIGSKKNANELIWSFSNRTARRIIKSVMKQADIIGDQACGRGLRHSFAIACVEHNIPITQVQKWLGHSDLSITSIYLDASGKEEREWARRFW